MIVALSTKITEYYLKNNIIDEKQKVKFEYGLTLFIELFLDLFAFLIVGILLKCMPQLLIYLIIFAIIRMHAGGYHAKSFIGCFMTTTIFSMTSILLSRVSYLNDTICTIVLIIASICICIMSPLDSSAKPLSSKLKKKCKKRTIIVCIAIMIISCILKIFNINLLINWYQIVSLAITSQCIQMIPDYYKKRVVSN